MLAETENYLIDILKTHFEKKVRAIDSHPGRWDSETLKQIASALPGLYVVFEDSNAIPSDSNPMMLGDWTFYVATGHANGNTARRHGNTREIGAYEMIVRTVCLLHGHKVPDVGTLNFLSIRNLFSFAFDRQGVTVYQIRFSLKMMFDINRAEGLENFETLYVEHRLDGEAEDELPRATETVSIPQE